MSEDEWQLALHDNYEPLTKITPADAKREFLNILSKWSLFGSRFFRLDSVSDSRIKGRALLVINRNGVAFLDPTTRATLLKYSFNEVVSTRRLGSRATGKHFVDLKLGNLMVQRVTRCETRQVGFVVVVVVVVVAVFVHPLFSPFCKLFLRRVWKSLRSSPSTSVMPSRRPGRRRPSEQPLYNHVKSKKKSLPSRRSFPLCVL
jgi:hypothetical protein